MVRVEREVELPIAPPKTISPVPAVRVRFWFPLIVLEKVSVPAPEPDETEVAPNRDTLLVKLMGVLTVSSVPDKETAPPPL
jgi:hypothetical protein